MKKLISLCSLSLLAYSANYEDSFLKKDYKSALEQGLEACKFNCDNPQLNLIIGKSAEKVGNMHEALAAYDRVLIFDEDNIEAHFAMAKIYAKNGNYELLKAELDTLSTNPELSPQQRAKLESLKALGEEKVSAYAGETKPYSLSISAGFGFDTNPNHDSNEVPAILDVDGLNDALADLDGKEVSDEDIDALIAEFTDEPEKKLPKAFNYNFSIYGSYEHEIASAFSVLFEGSFYHKHYLKPSSMHYPNIDVFSLGLTPKYYINESTQLALSGKYDYVIYKNHKYSHSFSLGLDVYKNLSDDVYLSGGYSLSKTLHIRQWDKEDNYLHHNLYGAINYALGKHYLGASLSYDKENAKDSFDPSSDFYSIGLGLSHSYAFTDELSLSSNLNYTRTYYAKYDEFYENKRADNDYSIDTELSYKITPNNTLGLSLGYSVTRSNQSENRSKNFSSNISYRYEF